MSKETFETLNAKYVQVRADWNTTIKQLKILETRIDATEQELVQVRNDLKRDPSMSFIAFLFFASCLKYASLFILVKL